jgi:hypothetical protein
VNNDLREVGFRGTEKGGIKEMSKIENKLREKN